MTNVTLERTAPTQNAPATYMPQAQGQAADPPHQGEGAPP